MLSMSFMLCGNHLDTPIPRITEAAYRQWQPHWQIRVGDPLHKPSPSRNQSSHRSSQENNAREQRVRRYQQTDRVQLLRESCRFATLTSAAHTLSSFRSSRNKSTRSEYGTQWGAAWSRSAMLEDIPDVVLVVSVLSPSLVWLRDNNTRRTPPIITPPPAVFCITTLSHIHLRFRNTHAQLIISNS